MAKNNHLMKNTLCIYHGKNLSAPDAAYLAGLVDGEGSLIVSRTHTSSSAKSCKRGFAYRAVLLISMTDKALLEWCISVTGVGKLYAKKRQSDRHRNAWVWTVWSNEAAHIAKQILPYLKLKRDSAENLIAFQSIMRRPGSKGLMDSEWLAREEKYLNSIKLNQRGLAA